jgi:hypothetical protein
VTIDNLGQRHTGRHGHFGKGKHRVGPLEKAKHGLVDARDAPGRTVLQLDQPYLHLMLQPRLAR